MWRLTWILCVLRADVVITGIEDILVHQHRSRRDLPKERHFYGLPDLDSLTFVYEDLASVFAPVFAVQAGHLVRLWVVAFLEWL